jgi:hypothetical protein
MPGAATRPADTGAKDAAAARGTRLSKTAGIIIAGAWPFLLNAVLFAVDPALSYHHSAGVLLACVQVVISVATLALAFFLNRGRTTPAAAVPPSLAVGWTGSGSTSTCWT